MGAFSSSLCRSVPTRGFTPQHQQLPWAPVARTRPLLFKKCPRHIHIQKVSCSDLLHRLHASIPGTSLTPARTADRQYLQPQTHNGMYSGAYPPAREQGYENALPGTGVPTSLTMASASSAAAATPELAPQVRPQQGLLTVRDMIQGASVCVLVALLLVVMSTLAIGGGLKVWHYLQGLHAQGVEAATWAGLVGLVVIVAGGVWLAGTLVVTFAQATRGVEQLKQQQQELQRELKQDMIDLKQELVSRLDRVLDPAYDKRLDAVEAAVYWRAGGQQASP